MGLIKPFKSQILNKSSLSQIPFQLQDIFLICLLILINCTLLLYLKILELSLTRTLIILFNFEIALAAINSSLIWQLTERLNSSRQILFSYTNLPENLAKKKNAIQF